jgi:hypothetical protein
MMSLKTSSIMLRKVNKVGVRTQLQAKAKRSTYIVMGMNHYRCMRCDPVEGLIEDWKSKCIFARNAPEVLISNRGQTWEPNAESGISSRDPYSRIPKGGT